MERWSELQWSLTWSQYFTTWHTKSNARDLCPLSHFISVMNKHDLTNSLTFFTICDIFDNCDNLWNFYCDKFGNFDYFDHLWQFITILILLLAYFFYKAQDNGNNKDNQRHWLLFWQLRTWIHDNLCDLTI